MSDNRAMETMLTAFMDAHFGEHGDTPMNRLRDEIMQKMHIEPRVLSLVEELANAVKASPHRNQNSDFALFAVRHLLSASTVTIKGFGMELELPTPGGPPRIDAREALGISYVHPRRSCYSAELPHTAPPLESEE